MTRLNQHHKNESAIILTKNDTVKVDSVVFGRDSLFFLESNSHKNESLEYGAINKITFKSTRRGVREGLIKGFLLGASTGFLLGAAPVGLEGRKPLLETATIGAVVVGIEGALMGVYLGYKKGSVRHIHLK